MMQPPHMFQIRLTEDAHSYLVRNFPPVHPNVFAHHVTLFYKPDAAQTEAMEEWLFEPVQVKVTGYYEDHKGQAVTVELPEGLAGNRSPHITISTAEGVEPVYSNELIAGDGERASGEVVGVVDAVFKPKANPRPKSAKQVAQEIQVAVAEDRHKDALNIWDEYVGIGSQLDEEADAKKIARRLYLLEKHGVWGLVGDKMVLTKDRPKDNPRRNNPSSPTNVDLVSRLKF